MKRSLGANTFVYPAPVLIVCTYDARGRPNAMAAAWGGVCCSKPPCVSVALRKATHTYGNLIERQAFALGIAAETQIREADYVGIYSGRDEDKLAALGWHAEKSELVDAPIVRELALVLECKLLHTLEIGLHTLFVGQVLDAKADADILGPDGRPDPGLIKPLVYAPGCRAYYALGRRLGASFSVGKKPG